MAVTYLDRVEELAQIAYERYHEGNKDAPEWNTLVFDDRFIWREVARSVVTGFENQSKVTNSSR